MNINDQLFSYDLVLGRHYKIGLDSQKKIGRFVDSRVKEKPIYLRIDSNIMTTVIKRPRTNLICDVKKAFANKDEVVKALENRPNKEIKALTLNLFYGLEKQIPHPNLFRKILYTAISTCIVGLLAVTFIGLQFPTERRLQRDVFAFDITVFIIASGLFQLILSTFENYSDLFFYTKDFKPLMKFIKFRVNSNSKLDAQNLVARQIFPLLKDAEFTDVVNFRQTLVERARELVKTDEIFPSPFTPSQSNNIRAKLVFRKFLRRKWPLQKDYYIVTHAQALDWAPQVDFFTALSQKLKNQNIKDFKYLRFDYEYQNQQFDVDQFFEKNMKAFLSRKFDDGKEHNKDLLSVSINLWDITVLESALDFWQRGSNIFVDRDVQLWHSNLPGYLEINEKLKNKIGTELSTLAQKLYSKAINPAGLSNLYAICLPKALVDNPRTNPIYEAKPFGIPVDVTNPRGNTKALKKDYGLLAPCQGRVFTYCLRPEYGVKILRFNDLTKNIKKEYYSQIDQLVCKAFLGMNCSYLSRVVPQPQKLYFLSQFSQEKAQQLAKIEKEFQAITRLFESDKDDYKTVDDANDTVVETSQLVLNNLELIYSRARRLSYLNYF